MTRRRDIETAIAEVEDHAAADETAPVTVRREIVDGDGDLLDVRRKELTPGGDT